MTKLVDLSAAREARKEICPYCKLAAHATVTHCPRIYRVGYYEPDETGYQPIKSVTFLADWEDYTDWEDGGEPDDAA